MRRGMTLVELLVVMAISLVIAGGLFYAYTEIFRKGTSQVLVAKNEQEAQFLISTLVSELSSVGFGIDSSRLKITNLNDVQNGSSLIAISNSTVVFLSLATRQNANIGCWGYVDSGGNLTTRARDYFGRECSIGNNTNCVCLEPLTKRCKTNNCIVQNCSDIMQNQNCRNALAFDIGDNSYPNSFITRYYLYTSPTTSPLCAPGTLTLMKRVGNDTAQPVVDCVGYFRVRYIYNDSTRYRDDVPNNDIKNLLGLRLCLLLQMGGRQSVLLMDVPQLNATLCGNPNIQQEWRYYRWSAIEVDIPLKNIR
ncbi:MAG: PilW family protein [Aquificaceae bacterium]